MYYYKLRVFVLKRKGFGVKIGTTISIFIISEKPIVLTATDLSNQILSGDHSKVFSDTERFDITERVTTTQKKFEKAKIKITVAT